MLNDFGQEIPDDTPIVLKVRGQKNVQFDQIREYIRATLREHVSGELETFEESNDFDVDDDPFPLSAAEYTADTEDADREVLHSVHQNRSREASPDQSSTSTGKPVEAPPVGTAGTSPAPPPQ